MEASYSRIVKYQAVAAAASLTGVLAPEAIATLRTALNIEKVLEQGIEKFWIEQRLIWNTAISVRCKLNFATWSSDYPPFPYPVIKPNLLLAEVRPLKFLNSKPKPIHLSLRQLSLKSTAELKRRSLSDWTIRWTE